MKRLACSLLIALLVSAPALAVDDKLASGVVSLHHLANILGIEVSREHVKNILTQKAERDWVVDSLTLIDADAVTYMENGHQYEETGYWHITYQFDGEHRLYDVKARHKMTFHGQSLEGWQDTHRQYRLLRGILHLWEKVGTEWKKYPPQQVSPRFLKPHFNPHWWGWPLWNLRLIDLFRFFKPVDVQQVNVDNSPHYLLVGRRTGPVDSDIEIWLNPQKAYRPTRVLMHNRSILGVAPDETPGEKPKPIPLETEYTLTRYTYQIEKFEPDIWFPKTVTRDVSFSTTDENQQPLPILRKTVMHVHRAVFNVPISEKDLGTTSNR